MSRIDKSKALFEWGFNLETDPNNPKSFLVEAMVTIRSWGIWNKPKDLYWRQDVADTINGWIPTGCYRLVIQADPFVMKEWTNLIDKVYGSSANSGGWFADNIIMRPTKRFSNDPGEAWNEGVHRVSWRYGKLGCFLLEDWMIQKFTSERVEMIKERVMEELLFGSVPI